MIYLDNNATTRLDESVLDAMMPFLQAEYANPASPYRFAHRSAAAVEQARDEVSALLGVQSSRIVFTSGGTESNNAALHAALAARATRKRVIVSSVEHEAVLEPSRAYASAGYRVDRVPVDASGRLQVARLQEGLADDVALVSIMGANNETGVCFDLVPLVKAAHAVGALFHTDATQCVGKVPINIGSLGVDLASFSAHKFHGPKGVGVLVVDPTSATVDPWQRGGDQEKGRRAGTLNVAGIVGCGQAARLVREAGPEPMRRMARLRDRLETGLLGQISDLQILGAATHRLPNTSSVHIRGVESEALLALLDQKGICCSSGSACMAASAKPSYVVEAMGLTGSARYEVVRMSLSRFTDEAEIGTLLDTLPTLVDGIRASRVSVNPPPAGEEPGTQGAKRA